MSDLRLPAGHRHPSLTALARHGVFAWAAGGFLFALAITMLAAPGACSVDSAVYIDMARAMVERGSLLISHETLPGALALKTHFTHIADGGLAPQYPGLYGVIAAPFYAIGGIRGLIFMNALAAVISVALTHRIALNLYGDRTLAAWSAGLLAAATFLSSFAIAVWPHVLVLALILAAVERVLAAANAAQAGWAPGLVAGLIFGLATAIRVDSILPFLGALVWLRLFGAPRQRITGLALIAGLAPGLLAASCVNWLKFGVFFPFSYGPGVGGQLIGTYLPAFIAAGMGLVGALLIDARRPWVGAVVGTLRVPRGLAAIAAAAILALVALPPLRQYLHSIYVLFVDIHQLDAAFMRPGIERQENGLLMFWGENKHALLQSLPFGILALIPLVELIRGGAHARAHALAVGVALVPVLAYSVNQWFGGFSLSMRYFFPSLPMLAMLAAYALRETGLFRQAHRRLLKNGLIAGMVLVLLGFVLARKADRADALAYEYWPTMILLGAVTLATAGHLLRPASAAMRAGFRLMAGAAVGASVAISATSLVWYANWTNHVVRQDRLAAEAFAPGSLLIMWGEYWFVRAKSNGVNLASLRSNPTAEPSAMEPSRASPPTASPSAPPTSLMTPWATPSPST